MLVKEGTPLPLAMVTLKLLTVNNLLLVVETWEVIREFFSRPSSNSQIKSDSDSEFTVQLR